MYIIWFLVVYVYTTVSKHSELNILLNIIVQRFQMNLDEQNPKDDLGQLQWHIQ